MGNRDFATHGVSFKIEKETWHGGPFLGAQVLRREAGELLLVATSSPERGNFW